MPDSHHKMRYPSASSDAVTITLNGLPPSASLITGRQSSLITNTSDLDITKSVAGKFRTGTSPAAGVIELWAVTTIRNNAGTYVMPDTFGITDQSVTVTSREILQGCGVLLWRRNTDTTSNRDWPVGMRDLESILGSMPEAFVLFVTHSTNVNLNNDAAQSYLHLFRQQRQNQAV